MCKCNKGLAANKSPIVSGAFALEKGNYRYSSNDFLVKYYIGESGVYIGSSTGIDYGYRTYNTKTMVHATDYEADNQLFSDSEQNVMRSVEPEPEILEVNDEDVEEEVTTTSKAKRSRSKKETEENVENTV